MEALPEFNSRFSKPGLKSFSQWVGAVASEVLVNFFETADEVENMVAGIGAAGGCAEMRAATEGAVVGGGRPTYNFRAVWNIT